jgi:hypothetical protein
VKLFGVIAIVAVLLFAGLHLSGHAPTHMAAGGGPEHTMAMP